MRKLLAILFIFSSLLTSAQVVKEIIPIDTSSTTLNVIYRPDTEGYYFKKIAVYADDTSKIAIEKTFTKYGQNGVYKVFYPSGKLMIFTVYANSKIHGDFTYFGEDGVIKVKGKYKFGVKHKFWAYKEAKNYGRYKQGLKNGRWTHTDVNGEKHVAHYQDGVFKYGEKSFFKEFISKDKVKKDTIITEEGIIIEPLNDQYQLVVDHLKSNYLLRKRFKYFYSTKKKERVALDKHFDYKKDLFKFRLAPVLIPLDLTVFTKESIEGKITNTTIDSVLKSETAKVIESKKLTSNYHSYSTKKSFYEYSTDKNAEVIIYLSKTENNIIKAEILKCVLPEKEIDYDKFYNENACKKMSILYYFDKSGTMSLEYENDPTP
jgi:antitoxin component YwqK of YwqJK toxin-antitoxin module